MTTEQNTSTDNLTADEREILEYMLQNEQQSKSAESGIPLCDHTAEAALSFGQLRSWLVHELNKEQASPYDTLTFNLHARGTLNVDALKRSLAEIVRRHEVLRTTYVLKGDEPVQVIGEARSTLEQEDLSGLPEAERECRLHELLQEAKDTLFDLAAGPLFRTRLICLGKTEHVLIMIMHHIIFDGWSNGLLMRELILLYENFAAGRPSPLPELPIQYRDFSVWQRNWLQGDVLQKHLGYWSEQLAELPALELPTDHPRPAVLTFNGASETLLLPQKLSTAVINLSKNHGVTLYMTMLSALGLLLHRYSQQDDIGIGIVIANRDREELQGLIGFFLNTLVMRLDFTGDPSFLELLERVKSTSLDGYAHQHLPFEKLVEEMQVERETNRTPLFQVSFFMIEAADTEPLKVKDLELNPITVEGHTTRFDLEVYITKRPTSLSLGFEYNTDLFEAKTIHRMLAHYQNLLASIVENPEKRLHEIQLLSKNEHEQTLVEWNTTLTDYPLNKTVYELFEDRVLTNAKAQAVVYGEHTLSYSELNVRANRLAHFLRAQGVEPGVIVGICLERSQEMVIGLLAILKAGGAYLPLDPVYPVERLSFMLKDSGAAVLLSRTNLPAGLATPDIKVVCLERNAQAIAAQSDKNVTVTSGSDDLAYVIYTSGSTGKPKGVQVLHRSLVNFLCSMAREPGLNEQDTLLAVTTLSFDIAGLELYLPLIQGARLVLASRDQAADGLALAKLITAGGVTVMQATPATWRLLLASGWEGSPVLKILCGGEALSRDLAEALLQRCAELWNMYGPTETTIWSTKYRVTHGTGPVPVGHPIDNTRVYIMDDHLNPVPVGVCGNLYIGGDGLAKGYLNRSELTAEKFIADPFSNENNARLYKTGDLARYRADGAIDYLGRSDNQIKLRGFRIELGEVESALALHPDIEAVVAIVRDDVEKGQRLLAYAVSTSESHPVAAEVREFLRQQLPDYMIPANVVWLDSFPLTPNGKLDTRALPGPPRIVERIAEDVSTPLGELETLLARIWEEVLDIDDINAYDMFFDLGGHSLLSIKVVNKFEQETGLHLHPMELVTQTLRQLISGIEARAGTYQKSGAGQ